MTTPTEFFGHPLVHALGWTLLHFLWQGTLAAIILWITLRLLGGRSSQARYGAACFALALLVAMPLMTFARIASAESKTRIETQESAVAIDAEMMLQVGIGEPNAPWPVKMAVALDRWTPWILTAWLVGAVFFVVRLNLGLIVAQRLQHTGTQAAPPELQHLFDQLKLRLGVARAVKLLHSARVQVPTVIGWLHPVVLIPVSCLTGLSTLQIEAIFCHELAHVRRHDYLVSVLQSVAEALLFYHPAVWWVSRQIRRERECCCDEIAVGNGGDVLAYAKALSYLEERRAAFPEFVLGANGGVLTMRIKRLLGCGEVAHTSQLAALTLMALICVILGSYVATVARAQPKNVHPAPSSLVEASVTYDAGQTQGTGLAPPQAEPATAALQPQPPEYKNWLDQDVVYLITPEERTAFLGLTHDEDRDQFIVQFWERRNPTPGSTMNGFKEQHYARLAYANQHFAADVPGWQTDRGRVWILNGKPESIDAHPSGGQSADGTGYAPFEVWHYPSAAGRGQSLDLRYVDDCMCGKYRLVPGPRLQANRAGPVRVSFGVMAGNVLRTVSPVYPAEAKEQHVQGVVVLHAIVSKTGEIENLSVISGPEMLRQSAIDAVQRWQYKPYLLNGQPTEVETTINVNFTFSATPPPQSQSGEGVEARAMQESSGPSTASGLRRIGGGVSTPVLTFEVEPKFSPQAQQNKFSGVVLVNLVVDTQGLPQSVHVLRGVGMGLDEKAVEAVRQYRFRAAMEDGKPVPVELNVEVNFRIFDSPKPEALQPDAAAANPDLVLRKIGGGVSAPVVIHQADPEYTKEAKKAKLSGVVLVNLIVDTRGMPQNVHVLRGLGMGLDLKAIEAVREYKFKPAMESEIAVPVSLNIEVNFRVF